MGQDLSVFKCLNCESSDLSSSENGLNIVCGNCSEIYPKMNGVFRFVSEKDREYTQNFGKQWNLHRKSQLDSYTGHDISSHRVFSSTNWDKDLTGQRILEAGSGAGRFTEILLKTGAKVTSFDFSSAVEANHKNNGDKENLQLFQGNMYNLPLKEASFDKVFCLGVIQHTPDPHKAFQSLAKYVKPGGELVIDSYASSLGSLLSWRYLLRPLTTKMPQDLLYRLVEKSVDFFLPSAIKVNASLGNFGRKMFPIVEYSHLGLPPAINRDWAILDTFDWYSPKYDIPQSIKKVETWYKKAGFSHYEVKRGLNGIVGIGKK